MFNNQSFKTLKLNKDGDISFDNLGGIVWCTNEESIAQTINIRLNTRVGDLFYDELFGLNNPYIKNTLKNTMLLESEIRYALVDDEKIMNVELIDVIIYNNNTVDIDGRNLKGSAILKIAVKLFDQSVVDVDFNIGGE